MSDIHTLRIYKDSLLLIKEIYELIRESKNLNNDFSLCDQIKRASVSVASNISEGYYRSQKVAKNYLSIASGSTNEVATQLEIIELVYKIDTKILLEKYRVLGRQINSLSSHF